MPDWLLEEWEEYFTIDSFTSESERAYAVFRTVTQKPGKVGMEDFMLSRYIEGQIKDQDGGGGGGGGGNGQVPRGRRKTTQAQWDSFFAGYGVTPTGPQGEEEN